MSPAFSRPDSLNVDRFSSISLLLSPGGPQTACPNAAGIRQRTKNAPPDGDAHRVRSHRPLYRADPAAHTMIPLLVSLLFVMVYASFRL